MIYENFYLDVPSAEDLEILKQNSEVVYYKSFYMTNPITIDSFPENDKVYYRSLEAQLKHLLYKYRHGWITSERQVMYSSDECISTIHFIFDENDDICSINVFMRSSNVLNLEEDVQFLNYFISYYIGNSVDLQIFVSSPHTFKNKKKKVE